MAAVAAQLLVAADEHPQTDVVLDLYLVVLDQLQDQLP